MTNRQNKGLALVRIISGLLMAYHGLEVFDAAKMTEYAAWDTFGKQGYSLWWVYAGKGSEFVAGLLLAVGLFTRIASVWMALTMAYITFFVGSGKFWYEDQHPFLFVLLGIVFFFTGPCTWSIDQQFNRRKTPVNNQ